MRIVLWGLLIVLALWLFLRLGAANLFWRRKTRDFFSHAVESLLLVKEDRGYLLIRHRQSNVQFRIVRFCSSGSSATLSLEVPKAPWSQPCALRLRQIFEAQDFQVAMDPTEHSPLLTIRIDVPDIWSDGCGARGARAAHLLLDAIGVPRDATFIVDLVGRGSRRLYDHYRGINR